MLVDKDSEVGAINRRHLAAAFYGKRSGMPLFLSYFEIKRKREKEREIEKERDSRHHKPKK